MPSTFNFNDVVGITLNGVFIYAATALPNSIDPLSPRNWGTNAALSTAPVADNVDLCLGTAIGSQVYHYFSFSACIYDSPISQVASYCNSNPSCNGNKH